jgi:hypothetical protein
MGMETAAFSQLTRRYMEEEFNPKTPDVEGIKFAFVLFKLDSYQIAYYSQVLFIWSQS